MKYIMALLILFSFQLAFAQPTMVVRETITDFDLTPQEILNPYSPVAYGFFGSSYPTKPATYYKPNKYPGKYQIIEFSALFNKPNNWRSSSIDLLICEGLRNSGPQENKRIGKRVTLTTTGVRTEYATVDLTSQNLIMEEGTEFFVVLPTASQDGSPWVLLEDLDYPTRKLKDGGRLWVYIYPSPGWTTMANSIWRSRGNNFGDAAMFLTVDYLEVPNDASPTTWEEVKHE